MNLNAKNNAQNLGIITGSGFLPSEIINHCIKNNQPFFLIAFEGITPPNSIPQNINHAWVNIGSIGKALKILKDNNVEKIVMAGRVGRPAFSTLKLDVSGLKLLSRLSRLKTSNDNEVFSEIIRFIERSGFTVIGADEVLTELATPKGVLGNIKPDKTAERDIEIGQKIALEIGKLDIGQAVIVQNGMVLGVEGAEGTDRLIERCAAIHNDGPGGVLIKMKKPTQDRRVDLPSVGVKTIENIHLNKLRGIAIEAGNTLIINRAEVIAKANELGVFVIGI